MARPLSGPSGIPAAGPLTLRSHQVSNASTALASDLLLARVQHAVGEAVLSHGRSRRYRHPLQCITGDHGVLVITKQTLNVLVVLDDSFVRFGLLTGSHNSAA